MLHKVWGSKPKPMMHASSKLHRRAPQGRGHFSYRLTKAEIDTLAALEMPNRLLTREQANKLQMLRRKANKP